jgi:hypothetical protein
MEKYLDASDVMWPTIPKGEIPVENAALAGTEVKFLIQDLLVHPCDPSHVECRVIPNSMEYFFKSKK